MQSMLYSLVVRHRCVLVYLCWDTPSFNTYKPDVYLIIPEKICLSPAQHIRHTPKILVNCGHNLTDMRVVIIHPVQIKMVLGDSACHTYLWSLSLYIQSDMPIDTVDISVLVMSSYNNNGPNGHLFYVGGDLMMRRDMLPIIRLPDGDFVLRCT